MSSLRHKIRTLFTWYRRKVWRNHQPQGYIRPLRKNLADFGAAYTFCLIAVTGFNGFWIICIFLMQLSSKGQSIKIFPEGLNDGVAIIPLTFLAFAAALTGAQSSVKNDNLKGLYGYSGRSFLHGFLFIGMAYVLALGHRLISEETFKNFPGSLIAIQIVKITPAFMWANAGVAACFLIGGLFTFMKILNRHE